MYLDEVSVYSLIASRLGPLAAEFTDTQSRSLQTDSSVGLSIESLGLKSNLGASSKDLRGSSSQVLRKSTVQATFKEFYEFEQNHLLFGRREPVKRRGRHSLQPSLNDWDDVTLLASDPGQSYVVDPERLERGALFELEVLLGADNVYKFSHMFSTMAEIINAEPGLFPGVVDSAFKNAESINGVISRLMAGLIPLRAEVVNYRLVRKQGRGLIVKKELLSQAAFHGCEVLPLEVAGVSEAKSYWQDTRRVLFSGLTFRVFGRITQPAVVEAWNPIKLTELLREAVPDLAAEISAVASDGLRSFQQHEPGDAAAGNRPREIALRRAAGIYVGLISPESGKEGERQHVSLDQLPIPPEGEALDVDQLRAIFNSITTQLERALDRDIDPVAAARARSEALSQAGLNELGSLPPALPTTPTRETSKSFPAAIVEAEIVAIYW